MQDPRHFPVRAQVQVLWPEAQEYYPATIEAVHQQAPDAVRYDVCYVQKVNNKDVVENGVEAWRVIPPPKEAVPTNRAENLAHERMKEAETDLVGSGKHHEPESTSVPMVIEGEHAAPAIEEAQDCEEADLLANLEDLLSPFTPDSTLEERAQAAAAICDEDICSSLLHAFKIAHSNEPLRLKVMLFASSLTWQQMQRDLSWNTVVIQDKPFLRALHLATGLLEQVVARDGNYTILPSESLLVPLQFVARLVSITFAGAHQGTQEADEGVAGKPATRARARVGAAARKKLDSSVMRIFTHISALFDAVSELHRTRRLEDTTIIASYEAALEAFSLDATTVSSSKVAAVLADGDQSLQLRRLHGSASALLQVLFQRYDSFRRTLMLELLSTMSHTCGSKKTARTFPLHFTENPSGPTERFTHRTTAALLHFLHSATNSAAVVSDSQQEPDASFEGMLENCRKCAKFFLGNLFQRAQVKESGMAYKQVIEHLLADVLACMQYPDWPAAEIVLSSLSSILVSSVQVLDPRSNVDVDRKDMVWHNFLLELLASMTTSLWKAIPQASPSATTSFPASLAADIQARCEDTMSKLAAAASVPEETTASAELRRIDRVLHFKAVIAVQVMEFQFLAMNEDGAPLFQQTLTTPDANQVLETVDVNLHARWRECAGASDMVSRVDSEYQILLEVLTSRSKDQPSQWKDVISLHRLLWHEHLKHQNNERLVQLLADSMHMDHMKTSCSDLSWRATAQSELVQAVMQELLLEKTLRTLADRLLNTTLLLVAQESPTIRAKIVKGLSSILAVSPHLMAKEEVRTCVVERFNDVAISVRQAAVDLVGSFVTSSGHALVVTHYLDALLDRLRDVGVSVRKSVVKICRDILLHFPGHPRAMDICHQLVERSAVVKEEDTIRDTIRDTFYRIWLSPSPALGSAESCAALGSLLLDSPSHHPILTDDSESLLLKTPSTAGQLADTMTTPFSADRTDDSRSASDDLEVRSIMVAKQLVDVVQSVASPQWMVRLFRDLLSCRADGADTKRADELKLVEAVAQCQRVVDVLIHAFLLLERTGTNVVGSWRMNKAWEDDMQGIMSTLAVFSEVQPSLLAGYLHILLPLLKADNGLANEGGFCLLVANIVARTVRLSTTVHQLTMNEALADLGRLCTKFEPPVVNGAMACMAHVIHAVAHDASKYLSLAQLCYSRVLALLQHLQAGRSMDDSQMVSFLPRCLLVLGSACRHLPLIDHIVSSKCNSSSRAENTPTFMELEQLPQSLNAASIYPQCYSLFVHTMTAVDDFRIQARAATALCGAFSACPQLMYHADTSGLLSKFLRGVFGDTVRLHVLQSLQEVMRAGEEIIGIEEKAILEAADQVHGGRCEDASIAGAVLQEYVPLFLQLLVDKDVEVKIEALALLGILLQQGMVCPHDVLPSLFALQGDDNELLRAESLRLIQVEDERRPGHLAAHCASGVFLAAQQAAAAPQKLTGALRKVAKYIKRTPTSEPDLIHQIQSIFAPAYASCLQSSRHTRTTFLNAVLKKCKEMLLSVSDAAQQKPRKTFHRASTAHALPAATRVAWVSFVVQTIAHLPYIVEDEVLMVIWWINRHTMLEASQVCTALASELQRRGVDLSMEEGLEASFTANSSQLTADLATLVPDALCLSSMHRLKHFLKTSFKLSTDKCLAFNPHAKCSDKQVVLSDLVFEPILFEASIPDLDAVDLSTPAWTDKIEDIFQQLVGDALETADDMGVLGGKRKAKKVAATAAPIKAVARRRGKPRKRRKVQKTTELDSESDDSFGGSDESEYEP